MKKGFIFTIALAMVLGVGVAVGAHHAPVKAASAYGPGDETWYVAGSFNEWDLDDESTHLSYSKMAGDNWEFESDGYIDLKKDDEFKIVYSWDSGAGANYFGPELLSNNVDFSGGNGSNVVVNRDIKVKFYFQVWGESATWTGLYWEEYSEPDVPAEDGYYLVGSETDNKYAGAPKMTQTDSALTGNVAVLFGYTAKVDETIKARSYFSGVDKWSFNTQDDKDFGEPDEYANFKFSKAGTYDIYAYYVGDDFKFNVEVATPKITVTLVAQQFAGKDFKGGVTMGSFSINKDSEYYIPAVARDGYAQQKTYEDPSCETEYAGGTVLSANTTLYVKYMKIGFYTISEAGGWKIATATAMNTDGIDPNNKAEALVVVAAANEKYSFVYWDGTDMFGHDGLGSAYEYAEDAEGGSVKFKVSGAYAVYWKDADNKIYLNSGSMAFITTFMSEVGGVCDADGKTNLEDLDTIWGGLKDAFENDLEAADQKAIKDIKFDGSGTEDAYLKAFMARYAYIVTKYGSARYDNFIFNVTVVGQVVTLANGNNGAIADSNTLIAVISVIALVSVSSVAILLVIKKRKHN